MNNNYIRYESNGDRNKKLSLKEYLDQTKPYLTDIVIYLKNYDIQKIQLRIASNFTSSKDIEELCVMHLKNNNIKFIPGNNANEVVMEFF